MAAPGGGWRIAYVSFPGMLRSSLAGDYLKRGIIARNEEEIRAGEKVVAEWRLDCPVTTNDFENVFIGGVELDFDLYDVLGYCIYNKKDWKSHSEMVLER